MTLARLSPYFLVLALGSGCTAAKHTIVTDDATIKPDCSIIETSREYQDDGDNKKVVAEHSRYLGWDKDCGTAREKAFKIEYSYKLLIEAFNAPGVQPQEKSQIAKAILNYLADESSSFKKGLEEAMEKKGITVGDIKVSLLPETGNAKPSAVAVDKIVLHRYACRVASSNDGHTTSVCSPK